MRRLKQAKARRRVNAPQWTVKKKRQRERRGLPSERGEWNRIQQEQDLPLNRTKLTTAQLGATGSVGNWELGTGSWQLGAMGTGSWPTVNCGSCTTRSSTRNSQLATGNAIQERRQWGIPQSMDSADS